MSDCFYITWGFFLALSFACGIAFILTHGFFSMFALPVLSPILTEVWVSERLGGCLAAGHSQPTTNSYLKTCGPGPRRPQLKHSTLAKNHGVFGGGIIMCSISNTRIFVEKVEMSEGFENWEI